MSESYKRLVVRIVILVGAGLLLAAMLKLWGVASAILVGLVGAGMLIFLAIKRAKNRKTEIIFGFYVAADEILGGDGSSRYRFEIADVIKTGETVVRMMPDAPPLSSFALGALYHSIGDHNGAVGHLALAAEEEVLKESPHVSPSRQLRRYVQRLRQIERRPERWPKISVAIRNLERMHHERAAHLLAENQVQLKRLVEAYDNELSDQSTLPRKPLTTFTSRSFRSISPPPPISEVLNDVYQEEQKSS